jgi:hypothetical protein
MNTRRTFAVSLAPRRSALPRGTAMLAALLAVLTLASAAWGWRSSARAYGCYSRGP